MSSTLPPFGTWHNSRTNYLDKESHVDKQTYAMSFTNRYPVSSGHDPQHLPVETRPDYFAANDQSNIKPKSKFTTRYIAESTNCLKTKKFLANLIQANPYPVYTNLNSVFLA